ncbi:MAG: hypothetical protein V2I38_16090 [Alcanivoracaceae bacterium]|jgi:hypothetical protein|nr:hypothetical protein [Alcanivoracaceae bacterium]
MLTDNTRVPDSSRFNDPLASTADWSPLQRGGSSFASYRRQVSANRFGWRPTLMVWALGGLFAAPALLVLVALLAQGEVRPSEPASWILPVLALLFIGFGIQVVRRHKVPLVFDRLQGWFWRGTPRSNSTADIAVLADAVKLADIHAVQLIGGQMGHGTHASWRTFELNLVLRDGRRLPLITHGSLRVLRDDASQLAEWLSRPLWDALK